MRRAFPRFAVLLGLALLGGCSRDASTREPITPDTPGAFAIAPPAASSPDPRVPSAAGAARATVPTHLVRVTVAKLPVEVVLPSGWELAPGQSDPSEGLVAFAPTGDGAEPATAFVDASQVAHVPPALAEATNEALARDACAKPSACTVLASETLPGGGYLVSMRTPDAVVVEAWRPAPADRAVRCGFEISALHAPPPSWLGDPAAVARARSEGEGICRSVKATP